MQKLLLTLALAVFPALLSAQSAPLACDGRMATVRISEIAATGTPAGFLAAVAAQKAWYESKGVADEIFVSRIVVRDEKPRAQSYSEKQFMTFHIRASSAPGPTHDGGYDAFVKLFRENSDIKSEYNVCMPKLPAK
jgi:hypothetical protein